MKEFWNERFGAHEFVYGPYPNAFFKQEIDKLQPGKLLLPAEGEGRNALYALQHGWDVTAFDYSTTAIQKATEKAQSAGFKLTYDEKDVTQANYVANSFHAIGLIYFHLPVAQRSAFHAKVCNWLVVGGTVILEAFTPKQLAFASGGPKDETMLYTEEMLQKDFSTLKILSLATVETDLQEGDFHKGRASVVRLVATKA